MNNKKIYINFKLEEHQVDFSEDEPEYFMKLVMERLKRKHFVHFQQFQ